VAKNEGFTLLHCKQWFTVNNKYNIRFSLPVCWGAATTAPNRVLSARNLYYITIFVSLGQQCSYHMVNDHIADNFLQRSVKLVIDVMTYIDLLW